MSTTEQKVLQDLYDALKRVPPEFDWEGDEDWEAWKKQRAEALTQYTNMFGKKITA